MQQADGTTVEDYGGERDTTNNRMEMTAILMALKALPNKAVAAIRSDSQYCINGLTIWRNGWMRRQWKKKDGAPMPNRDLWLALEEQRARVKPTFVWVRGHNGDVGNERADHLATLGMRSQKAQAPVATRTFFAPAGDLRLTVNIRSDLHLRLKLRAANERTTIGELIEDWVEKWPVMESA